MAGLGLGLVFGIGLGQGLGLELELGFRVRVSESCGNATVAPMLRYVDVFNLSRYRLLDHGLNQNKG